MNDRLYRSRDDRILGGVCAGLAERFDLDPSIVRILWALLTLLTGLVPGAVIYVVMLIVVPEAPYGAGSMPGSYPQPGPGATPGWAAPPATPSPGPPPGDAAATTGAAMGFDAGTSGQATTSDAGAGQPTAPPTAAAGWVSPGDAYAERRARRAARGNRNNEAVALVFGAILVLVGLYFLFDNYLPRFDWSLVWPFIIIGLGVVLLVGALVRQRPSDGDGPTA